MAATPFPACIEECTGLAVDATETPGDLLIEQSETGKAPTQGIGIRRLGRPEATVAVASEARTQCTATRARNRAETGFPFCHHDTHGLPAFAFHTDFLCLIDRHHAG